MTVVSRTKIFLFFLSVIFLLPGANVLSAPVPIDAIGTKSKSVEKTKKKIKEEARLEKKVKRLGKKIKKIKQQEKKSNKKKVLLILGAIFLLIGIIALASISAAGCLSGLMLLIFGVAATGVGITLLIVGLVEKLN